MKTLLLGAAAAAMAGCAADTAQVEVRPLADPAAKLGAGSERLAEARGQLVLGNVGLAIEGFHAALREQPTSIEAMGGLAACYDSMGRTDLSRQYFEAALAVAPRNAAVLNAFAASLEAQGRRVEAMELRSEAALASRAPAPIGNKPAMVAANAAAAPSVLPATPAVPSIAVAAAPAPATVVALAPPPSSIEAVPVRQSVTVPVASAPSIASAAPARPSVVAATVPAANIAAAAPVGQSVTIALPAPRPAAPEVAPEPTAPQVAAPEVAREAAAAEVAAPEVALQPAAPEVAAPEVAPEPAAPETPAAPAVRELALLPRLPAAGPRLQRLSPGEVALLTTDEPVWQPRAVARTAQSTTVRPQSTTVHWVALNDTGTRPNIRLLNAARNQGLAARTRDYLLARGWRKIEIGDADAVRESSLVMYPEGRHNTGRSLAAQFGFRPGLTQQGQVIVVLLGRDATTGRGAQARA